MFSLRVIISQILELDIEFTAISIITMNDLFTVDLLNKSLVLLLDLLHHCKHDPVRLLNHLGVIFSFMSNRVEGGSHGIQMQVQQRLLQTCLLIHEKANERMNWNSDPLSYCY